MSLAVVVLLPNGRRQTVKVTPKFSILQVLEAVCTNQGLNSDDYELKHYKKILDLSSTVQFSNLSNNAQLELVKASNIRLKTNTVNVGLQLEMGERLIADFPPSISIWDMVNSWDITRALIMSTTLEQGLVPVCVYMRSEIAGQEALARTTLRSLGLVGGKAMIRLFFRQAEMLKQQAHVEVPLARIAKPSKDDDDDNNHREMVQDAPPPSPVRISQAIAAGQDSRMEVPSPPIPTTLKRRPEDLLMKLKRTMSHQPSRRYKKDDNSYSASDDGIGKDHMYQPMDLSQVSNVADESQVFILGERRAIVFSLDGVHNRSQEELPDEFYNLTIEDIRYLHEDLIRQREESEKFPKETALLHAETLRKKFERYKQSVIRVLFPDRLILQGLFDSTETIADVMAFVSNYVSHDVDDFYLFTAPPKELLPPTKQLFSASLVPKALVYFGSNVSIDHPLKEEIRNKLSSSSGANRAALNVGQIAIGDNPCDIPICSGSC